MRISSKISKMLLGVALLGGTEAYSQQDPQYTNYMYNTVNINPAYAGNRGVLSVFGLHRTQWVGLDGAPSTSAFSIHTPIDGTKLGVGLSFVNDGLGVTDENTASIDVSYTLDLNQAGSRLSFGVKGSGNFLNVAYSRLRSNNPNDPYLNVDIANQFSPNIGAGVYWHNDNSYLGLSVPNLLENKRTDSEVYSQMNQRMHFFLTGGHVFEINPMLKFKPAFLLKALGGAPLQADVTGNFLIQEKLVLGAGYRWDAAWSALAGFHISDALFIGYTYDSETTKLHTYNKGSHEVFLRYELFNKYRRVNSPRFF